MKGGERSEYHSGADETEPLTEHVADHLPPARAERHPDADLLAPLQHGVADDGVEADRPPAPTTPARRRRRARWRAVAPPDPPRARLRACALRSAEACRRASRARPAARAPTAEDRRWLAPRGTRPPPAAARAGRTSRAGAGSGGRARARLHHADDLLHPLGLPGEVDAPAERDSPGKKRGEGPMTMTTSARRRDRARRSAAGEHRRAQHVEVAGRDDPLLGERLRVGRKLAALDDDGAVDAAVERQVVDVGRGASPAAPPTSSRRSSKKAVCGGARVAAVGQRHEGALTCSASNTLVHAQQPTRLRTSRPAPISSANETPPRRR